MSAARPYRLGLDLGSNSIGWFVVWLDAVGEPVELGPGGIRIFPDGRDERSRESNAMARRLARGMRRRRDRFVRRRSRLMAALIESGLMPAEEAARKALETLDPYALRAAALDRPLPLGQIGRAIFHLDQRRGFKSNRKSDKGDGESGLIKQAAGRLEEAMAAAGAPSLGHYLAERKAARMPVRTRMQGSGAKASYDFYPMRDMVEAEFEAIWAAQAPHHPEMTAAVHDRLHRLIFFQRPLKAVPAGKCSLSPAVHKDDAEGFRCPRAHPLAQRFRIWQEVRNLRIQTAGQADRALTIEEGDRIALALLGSNGVSFDKMRGLLKLPGNSRFNLESEKRDKLKGDETAERLSNRKLFHKTWRALPVERQIEIVNRLLEEEDESRLIDWLRTETGVDKDVAEKIAGTMLPDGYSRLGLRAIKAILPEMEKGLPYDKACIAGLGTAHSPRPTGEQLDRLPYYGEWLHNEVMGSGEPSDPPEKRFGRLPNPTVHIGLGQLRRLVNALIERIGPPAEVVVEMTREFRYSPQKLKEIEKEQAQNQWRNDLRREQLMKLGQAVNHRNLLKLRLWEELNFKDAADRHCPFSGERISVETLLSDAVEIEHLIPFQLCFDDSPANKTVVMRYANRHKGRKTPHQAFGNSPTIEGKSYLWSDIVARAALLPRNKRWRFAPDALAQADREGGFLNRQLNETGWLARMAKDYMGAVCDPNKVWVIPGRLTALIRAKWGLNFSDAKDRNDHRHHGIDALVAALTSRGLLQAMASAFDEERDRIIVPEPWPGFRDQVLRWRDTVTISHRPEHGTGGRLHEDTAYGLVRDPAAEEGRNLVYRKSFTSLTEKEIGNIRDRRLRDMVAEYWATAKPSGIKLDQALQDFAAEVRERNPHVRDGIRHVRLLKPEKADYLVPIKGPDGVPYKAYAAGENAFIDILETADGRWIGEVTTVFAANSPGHRQAWRDDPGLRFVMRVFKGDLLRLERDGRDEIMVVRRLEPSASRLRLCGHTDAGKLTERHDDPDDPFRWLMASYSTLKSLNAERVRVDELGTIWRIPPEEGLRHILNREKRDDRPGR